MTDLDTFRAALQQPDEGRPPAIADIMRAGRRLRRKRRFGYGAVVAAALVAVTAVAWPTTAPPATVWPAAAVDAEGSWGQPVATGLRSGKHEIVVTAFHNVNQAYPDITFGVRACAADTSGKLGPCHNQFDDVAPDRSPGFHAIGLPSNLDYVDLPMYGYYVGPATTITVDSRGRTVTADTAVWSEDPEVVLFWFDFKDVYLKPDKTHPNYKKQKVTPGELPDVANWSAYDESGRKLPLGKPFVIG
ncbi:hypothetical protein JIG36_22710 [Actinoplanes sp. LDG1-06]|uniref:Uncharacterized protein n=1 Tax=Paractinoplanes ovalisporus TaxID=2810368 RepID=A0ABS2AEX3_9ACTN|nr:hypothetical protein [Actinoplanes ovalisporus]MBM2618376.1 hypothetical protein [Actinoplanes ovalisporus]